MLAFVVTVDDTETKESSEFSCISVDEDVSLEKIENLLNDLLKKAHRRVISLVKHELIRKSNPTTEKEQLENECLDEVESIEEKMEQGQREGPNECASVFAHGFSEGYDQGYDLGEEIQFAGSLAETFKYNLFIEKLKEHPKICNFIEKIRQDRRRKLLLVVYFLGTRIGSDRKKFDSRKKQ